VVGDIIRSQIGVSTVSLDAAAKSLNTSVRTLQREMDREGLSFREMTRRVRTERAVELLRETDQPVTAIATELGYSSPSNFTRAFRRETQMTPGGFRQTGH
jgi:AraC-like DNA-binding protein